MSTELKTDSFETFKKILVYCVMVIWINNSAFSMITLLSKITGFIKSKVAKKKVGPDEKTEKRIVVTNLCT